MRRKFYDIHVSRPTPITTHVLAEIAKLYQVEAAVRGSSPEQRRAMRQAESNGVVTGLQVWLTEQVKTLSRKSVTMEAITYAFNQWQALSRYLNDGRIEIDNNAAERSVRGIAIGRNYARFAVRYGLWQRLQFSVEIEHGKPQPSGHRRVIRRTSLEVPRCVA